MFQSNEGTAADEQDVGGVHLDKLLMRMFASRLVGNVCNRAFNEFEECLLNAFTRDVSGNGGAVTFSADLVDFVDVDNSALSSFDVVVGGLKQLQDNVLDVFTDITRFGQRRGIREGEGDIEELC